MKQAQIQNLSGAEFTTSEISAVKRIIVDKTFNETKALISALTLYSDSTNTTPLIEAEQSERKLLRSYILIYFDKYLDGTVKVKGGKRGTDFDNSRDKSDTRKEVRRMLGLPSMTDEELEEWEILHGLSSNDVSSSIPVNRV